MIRKSIVLPCPPARAFALFTEQASAWWPETRRHTQDPQSEIRMIPSGRFWERSRDGHEVELGQVRLWDPPHRLILDFYIGTDPQHPTDVVVTFVGQVPGTTPAPVGQVPGTTLVTVEHRPTPVSEGIWQGRVGAFERSWDQVLGALEGAAGGLSSVT